MIIDTHSHYDDEQFTSDRHELLIGLKSNNVEYVVNAGASMQSTKAGIQLALGYDFVYAMAGVHPDSVGELEAGAYDELKALAADNSIAGARPGKVVAIGEIGLDYHWMVEPKEVQQKWFREQLRLARDLGLPVNIHSRDAAEDTWTVMKEEHLEEIGGIIHCYSGSVEMSDNYLNAGFSLGIGGVVTFKNSKKLKDVVIHAPIERLVLETDCPYLAPEPLRGTRNNSANLIYVAAEIARLKGLTTEEVIDITHDNALKIYGITQK